MICGWLKGDFPNFELIKLSYSSRSWEEKRTTISSFFLTFPLRICKHSICIVFLYFSFLDAHLTIYYSLISLLL